MPKSAVIINPKAGRGTGKGLLLAEALKAQKFPAQSLLVLETFDQLYPALARFAADGVDTLFISSGDGTVQAIQTWIAESNAFNPLPRLCLLPHGTTNMTAADLGFRRRNISDQSDFICYGTIGQTTHRHTVRVANPAHGKPQHGMFFGTGAVAEATRYCQVMFNDRGVHGSFATFATLASIVGKTLFTAPNPHDPNRFDRPYPLKVTSSGNTLCDGQNLLMLATTLEKLILGSKPFWGGNTAPLRVTTMPYPIPSVVRWLVPSLYGGENRTSPPGAVSRAVSECEVTCPTSFVMDGEFLQAPADVPLRIGLGPRFEYIVA
jgi:diacylglycerol kinase (ATP)